VKSGDLFLFFFAGHGVFLKDENYLLAYESDVRPLLLPKTGLSVEELNEYLSKLQSGNIILMLDACRNSPKTGRGDEDNPLTGSLVEALGLAPQPENKEDIKFRVTIYASDIGQRAYEWPGKDRGFFSMTLEEALSGKADRNGDQLVTLNEIGVYLGNRVPDLIKRELGGTRTQTPRIDISGDPRAGDLILSWATGQDQITSTPTSSDKSIVSGVSRELQTGSTQQSPQFSEAEQYKPIARWVDATGGFFGANATQEEARQSALSRARRDAVEKALGTTDRVLEFQASCKDLQEFHQAFIALNQSDIYGRIVEESEPVWEPIEKIEIRPGEPSASIYSVNLRAKVVQERSQYASDFSVSIKLNNDTFRVGEEMIVSIVPSFDCYITVFNALPDCTALVLDTPHKHTSKALSGQPFSLSTKVKYSSYPGAQSFPTTNTEENTGSILVIATEENIPLLAGKLEKKSPVMPNEKKALEVLPTYESALEMINNWLVNIPLDKRTFDIQQYQIKPPEK
jgi:hypothetical protein